MRLFSIADYSYKFGLSGITYSGKKSSNNEINKGQSYFKNLAILDS